MLALGAEAQQLDARGRREEASGDASGVPEPGERRRRREQQERRDELRPPAGVAGGAPRIARQPERDADAEECRRERFGRPGTRQDRSREGGAPGEGEPREAGRLAGAEGPAAGGGQPPRPEAPQAEPADDQQRDARDRKGAGRQGCSGPMSPR
jgi:hypothetical protein